MTLLRKAWLVEVNGSTSFLLCSKDGGAVVRGTKTTQVQQDWGCWRVKRSSVRLVPAEPNGCFREVDDDFLSATEADVAPKISPLARSRCLVLRRLPPFLESIDELSLLSGPPRARFDVQLIPTTVPPSQLPGNALSGASSTPQPQGSTLKRFGRASKSSTAIPSARTNTHTYTATARDARSPTPPSIARHVWCHAELETAPAHCVCNMHPPIPALVARRPAPRDWRRTVHN